MSVLGKRKHPSPGIEWKRDSEDSLYEFSTEGQVRRCGKSEPLKIWKRLGGKLQFGRLIDKKHRCVFLAPAVCTAFHGPRPSPDHVVMHIDKDQGNCRPDNLSWTTRSALARHYSAEKFRRGVRQLSLEGVEIKVHESVRAAAASVGVDAANITTCCRGRQKSAGGFIWTYTTERVNEATDKENETWRKFPDQYDAPSYMVSSLGRVKNTRTNTLVAIKLSYGYPLVCFRSKHKKTRAEKVHRLVALAFLGPPPSGEDTVDHINGDKQDNRCENLRWLSIKANSTAATGKRVARYSASGVLLATYDSVAEAARQIDPESASMRKSISACANGRRKSSHGCIFKFL